MCLLPAVCSCLWLEGLRTANEWCVCECLCTFSFRVCTNRTHSVPLRQMYILNVPYGDVEASGCSEYGNKVKFMSLVLQSSFSLFLLNSVHKTIGRPSETMVTIGSHPCGTPYMSRHADMFCVFVNLSWWVRAYTLTLLHLFQCHTVRLGSLLYRGAATGR